MKRNKGKKLNERHTQVIYVSAENILFKGIGGKRLMSKHLIVKFNEEDWVRNVEFAKKNKTSLAKLVVQLLDEAQTIKERDNRETSV